MKRFIVPLLVAVMVVSIIFAGCMPAAAPPVTPPPVTPPPVTPPPVTPPPVTPPEVYDPEAKWALEEPIYPVEVDQWYGTFDIETAPPFPLDPPAGSLGEGVYDWWPGPAEAERTYHIGYVMPHLFDPWWASALYGIIDEARIVGVDLTAYNAGGYGEITRQLSQIESLMALPVDAIIAAPVSYSALTPVLQDALDAGIPVILFVNDADLPHPTAKVMTSYYLTYGKASAAIVIEHSKEARAGGEVPQIGLFPGPPGLMWTGATEAGFKDKIAEEGLEDEFEIVAVKWGVSEATVQLDLIEAVLVTYPELDYIVACGPGATAGIEAVEAAGREGKTYIVSTYLTQPLYFAMKEGKVLASPAEWQQIMARMAVDMAVWTLNGEQPGVDLPFHSMARFTPITMENINDFSWEHLFMPDGWEPVFRYAVPAGLRVP
jgi:protein TorT